MRFDIKHTKTAQKLPPVTLTLSITLLFKTRKRRSQQLQKKLVLSSEILQKKLL